MMGSVILPRAGVVAGRLHQPNERCELCAGNGLLATLTDPPLDEASRAPLRALPVTTWCLPAAPPPVGVSCRYASAMPRIWSPVKSIIMDVTLRTLWDHTDLFQSDGTDVEWFLRIDRRSELDTGASQAKQSRTVLFG
jgi:hypothetical protein